jgi:hypothetical protein
MSGSARSFATRNRAAGAKAGIRRQRHFAIPASGIVDRAALGICCQLQRAGHEFLAESSGCDRIIARDEGDNFAQVGDGIVGD